MADQLPLAGTNALVTGASAGIGRETARVLARDGANVAVAARRRERLSALAEELEHAHGVEALVTVTDVTSESDVEAMVEDTVTAFGSLDIVVNNAGTGTARGVAVEDLDTAQYETVMAVNTTGMFYTARAAIPYLRDTQGVLVFVGSFAGRHPRPGNPVYAATKYWTRGFALSLAGHLGADGVGVSLVNPSEVRTEFGKDHRDVGELPQDRYAPGEVTEPEAVAEAITFAARQDPPDAVTELDLYRRDKFADY